MKLTKFLAPVAIAAAALTMSACTSTPTAAPAPAPTYTQATITTPAVAPAPKVKAPAPKPAVKPVAKVATPPMDHITAPTAVRCEEDEPCWNCHTMGNLSCAPIADPAAYVAAAHRQAPAPVFKGRTSAPGQTFPVPSHAEPAHHQCTGHEQPGLCNMAGGPGMVIPRHKITYPVTQPFQLVSVVVHITNGVVTSCSASVWLSPEVVPCTPDTLKLHGNPSGSVDVPCTLAGKPCTATTRG